MKRGEIYYISIPYATGCEIQKDRPAVIVGCGNAYERNLVQVVFLTAKPKLDSPSHVTIRETPQQSTAICTQLYTVDVSRMREYLGECSAAEMRALDLALLGVLGLSEYAAPPSDERGHGRRYGGAGESESGSGDVQAALSSAAQAVAGRSVNTRPEEPINKEESLK